MTFPHDSEAAKALRVFLSQMCTWETRYASLDEALEDDPSARRGARADARAARAALLHAWCAPALLDNEMLNSLALESPSRFEPGQESLMQIGGDDGVAVFVYRQAAGLKTQFRLALARLGGQWRVVQADVEINQAWERHIL